MNGPPTKLRRWAGCLAAMALALGVAGCSAICGETGCEPWLEIDVRDPSGARLTSFAGVVTVTRSNADVIHYSVSCGGATLDGGAPDPSSEARCGDGSIGFFYVEGTVDVSFQSGELSWQGAVTPGDPAPSHEVCPGCRPRTAAVTLR